MVDNAGTTATPSVTEIEVAGLCCSSEVDLIERKLGAMPGVSDIKVNLMLRRVAVTHDAEKSPAERLVRTLNWSLLGASIVQKGSSVGIQRGGLRTKEAALAVVCFVLFAIAGGIWARPHGTPWYRDPFSYSAIACIAVGSPVLVVRSFAGLYYQRRLNMFATMLIAVVGACVLLDLWEAAAIVFFAALSEFLQVCSARHAHSRHTCRRRSHALSLSLFSSLIPHPSHRRGASTTRQSIQRASAACCPSSRAPQTARPTSR